MTLSNGSKICDFNGNVFQWVRDDVQGNEKGLMAKKIKSDSISLTTAPYKSETKGMGYRPDGERDWSGRALVRGGCWSSNDRAGVFYLIYCHPEYEGDTVGFRCTQS
jgi:formylglycine-generating enzyme required for sulfatase activity